MDFAGEQRRVVVFDFAGLAVIRINAHKLLGGNEFRLELVVGRETEAVEIAEIVVAALFVAGTECAAAVGRIAEEPTVGFDIELRPVVAADGCGRQAEARCPTGGNAGQTAKRDEQEALHSPRRLRAANSGIFS